MSEEAPIDILRHLPRQDPRKGPSLGVMRADKHMRLREPRLATYRGQMKSLPKGVDDKNIIKRIENARKPPIEAYIGP